MLFSIFLESNSILSPRHAGFRPGRSTLNQILYLSQSISDGFDKPRPGSRTIFSTIDFSKTFDSVWHAALFHILISAGLPPCFARWTQSFLSDRRACVIGPVLLSLFINDLPASLPSSIAAPFTLTIWPFGPPPLGPHCGGGHTRSSVSIGELVGVLVSSSQSEKM